MREAPYEARRYCSAHEKCVKSMVMAEKGVIGVEECSQSPPKIVGSLSLNRRTFMRRELRMAQRFPDLSV
jgi:hypothetical protein